MLFTSWIQDAKKLRARADYGARIVALQIQQVMIFGYKKIGVSVNCADEKDLVFRIRRSHWCGGRDNAHRLE